MLLPFKAHRGLYLLLLISCLIRLLAAGLLELGNDEVYYWTYAAFPDWSHFDHPPMVGYLIQLSTLNLLLDNELFIRLGAVISMSIATYVMYLMVLRMANTSAAFISALLLNGSLYASIISGVFIMPDSLLLPLWLVSLYLLLNALGKEAITKDERKKIVFAGFTIGLAVLSKYHAAFLWFGAGMYILLNNRKWLREPALYLSLGITVICTLPILLWNVEHDFISFRFQGERVQFFEQGLRPDRFFTELFGQFFYNNPLVVVLTVATLFAVFKTKIQPPHQVKKILLFTALPLIGLILFFALFRKTLPHWSGPAYVTLIPLVALFVSESSKNWHRRLASSAMPFCYLILIVGLIEINMGLFTPLFAKADVPLHKTGKHDVTLDMYGWKQFEHHFSEKWLANDTNKLPVVSHRWFNAAHLDFYVATPNNLKLYAFGDLKAIHKYAWINAYRGELPIHSNAWYITPSRAFKPVSIMAPYFESTIPQDTIAIYRSGQPATYFFVYKLLNYKGNYENPLVVRSTQ